MTIDRLNDMLRMQHMMQYHTYGHDLVNMDDHDRIQFIKDNILAATDELHEAMAETGWKPWATSKHINHDAYFGELVDLWHFVMNLMLATGARPDTIADALYEGYMAKRQKNIERQETGYDGVKGKCSVCRRALDDSAVKCWEKRDQGWCDTQKTHINILETR